MLALHDLRRLLTHRRRRRGDERRGAARHRRRLRRRPAGAAPAPRAGRLGRQPAGAAGTAAAIVASAPRAPDVHPGAGRLLAALRAAGARRRPRHPRPRRARSPAASSPPPSTTRSSPTTGGSSPTATSTAPRSATCWTSSRSRSPTSPASSERRTDRFLDAARSHGLPPFLADDPGVDSGLMIAQYTAAGIVSELKRLAVPASVDSIPSLGDAGGPRLDGLGRRPQAAPRGRRAGPRARHRAPHRGARPRPARAAAPGPRDRRRAGRRPRRWACGGPAPTGTSPRRSRRSRTPSAPGRSSTPPRPAAGRPRADPPDLAHEYREDLTVIGARPVRAPRGTTLTARSWQTEAPLRMLMNNLDPEVAERPDDLVVYGGTGRAARDWASFDAIVRTLTTLEDDETLLVQSGRPVGVLRTHEWAPRVLIANSNLVRRLGDLAGVPPARAPRPDDVRADDRGVVDLHRHPGHPAGHVRDVRRGGRQEVRRDARRHAHRDGRLRRHGRRPAARRHAQRRRLPRRGRRPAPPAPARRARATSTRSPTTSTTRSRRVLAAKAERRALSVGLVGQLRRGAARAAAPGRRRRRRHRPDLGARPAVLPADRRRAGGLARLRRPPSPRSSPTGRARRWPGTSRRWSASRTPAPRSSTTATRSATRPARAGTSGPSPSPASCPPTSGRCSARARGPFRWAALSGDPADIAATDRAVLDLFPDDDHLHRWIRAAQERVAFQGLPARICWLGLRRARPGRPAVQRDGRVGRAVSARRHRPGPPGHGIGRLARTGRPRRCSTAPTPSPTGRC